MNSIQQIFQQPLFEPVTRVAVFRCPRKSDSYLRNIEWLINGETGWWSLSHEQHFGGVVILLDSSDKKLIEVWAGRSLVPNSGRLKRSPKGTWKLAVEGPFQFMGGKRPAMAP